jgi:hypothetical protein
VTAGDPAPEHVRVALHTSNRPRRQHETRDWTAEAACAGTDVEIFFPPKGGTPGAAKAVCAGCPVIADCLVDALGAPWLDGVWAATTVGDRRRLRKELDTDNLTEPELRALAARFAGYVRAIADYHRDHGHTPEEGPDP